VGIFESQIEDELSSAVREQVAPLLQDFLSGFEVATAIDIPAPVNISLNLSSALDMLGFSGPVGSGYGDLGLYTQVYPSSRGATIPWDSRGSVRKNGSTPAFSSTSYAFGVGLKDDLINQVLWGMWYGGGLNISDLSSLLDDGSEATCADTDNGATDPYGDGCSEYATSPSWCGNYDDGDFTSGTMCCVCGGGQTSGGGAFDNISLSFDALSPPVLMPGEGDDEIQIGLGDVLIDAAVNIEGFGNINVSLYLSTIIGGFLDIDPTTNSLIVSLDNDPDIWVQVVDIDEPSFQGPMSDLFTEVLRLVVPQLLSAAVGSIPLPEFDVGGLAGLPQSEVWGLTNGSLDRTGSYYRMTGSLQ
jgi:hypothetical protein